MPKFYFDLQGDLHAFADDGSEDGMIKPSMRQATEEELSPRFTPNPLTPDDLKARITAHRWEVETGGITLPTGVHVSTGIDDQNRITSVIANARLAGLESVSFKAASGWVTLTLTELEGVAAAIAMHVQQCFNAERAHHEAIDALEQLHAGDAQALQQALEAYDAEQGWPSADLQTPQPA